LSHAGGVTGVRRPQPWIGGPSLGGGDGGGGGDDTSHCGGPHAAAAAAADGVIAAAYDRGGDDFANTPPGCTVMSLQPNRKRAPPCL
jgi:hypothetical protein